MAFDFSKLNFFSKLDARARVFVLFGGVIGVGVLIYIVVSMMSSGATTTGPSSVAGAPQGLQSVPGGQLTPEYYRALAQANVQAAQQATITGGSAVPTLVRAGQQGDGNCTVLCSDESADVKNYLDDWVRQGKMSADTAATLQDLANKNVSESEYAAALAELVRQGKLTPEQARMLLDEYKKQHRGRMTQESAKTLDAYIKSGKLSLDDANKLLDAQKKNVTPDEYSAMLQAMVKSGKLDPDTAKRLLSQYIQQRASEIIMRSITSLRQMVREGQLTQDVEKELEPLEQHMVPLNQYESRLQGFVDAGKLTPAVSKKILDEFKQQKKDIGTTSSIEDLLQAAINAAYQELVDLQNAGKITAETANQIRGMISQNVSYSQFEAAIGQMVQEGKLTPEISKLKLADYKKIQDILALRAALENNRANNMACSEDEPILKRSVQEGSITPEEAATLMKECQSSQVQVTATLSGAEEGGEFSDLQRRLQASTAGGVPVATEETAQQFTQAQQVTQQETLEARQARLQAISSAMQGQAQQLLAAWAPPVMAHKEGLPKEDKTDKTGEAKGKTVSSGTTGEPGQEPEGPVIIKGGTILFAVLDTAVNSDYPDSPVLATIVAGKYKGAKLLGKLITTKGVSGQMDRVTLNFISMNLDEWPKSRSITAFGIDPDTAKTVLASNVNYHYMQRFGALMATSFLQGYGQAALSSGGTSQVSAQGTTTTNATLSPSSKVAVAFGQMAQALGDATKKYTERPPTVVVDSGVGLGILFMNDVT